MANLQGGKVTWIIDGDNKAFKNSLADSELAANDAAQSINKTGNSLSKTLGNTFSSIGSTISRSFTAVASTAATAIVGLGVKGITSANQLQSLQLQMNGLTKSIELGAQAMAGAYNFAQKSPFQLPDVAATTKTLIAFGLTTKDAVDSLQLLGNISVTTGIPLQGLGGIFGQVSAQGKLMLGDIRQLTENGIAILPALQKEFGKTADEVADMATRGQISFDQFKIALASLVDPTILDQLTNTLPRQLDRLGGSVRILSNAFVGVSVDAVNGFKQASDGLAAASVVLVKTLADALRAPDVTTAATALGNYFVPVLNAITANLTQIINFVARVADGFSKLGAYAIPIVAVMVTSIGKLGSGIPVIGEYLSLVSSPLIVLAGLFGTLILKSTDFRNAVEDGFAIIQETFKQLQPIFSNVLGILGNMVQTIGSALAPVVSTLAKAFANILIALAPAIPVLATFVGQLVGALLPVLPPIIKAFQTITLELINALVPVLPTLTKAIVDLVTAFVPLIPQLVQIGVIFLTALVPVLPQLVNAFSLLVEALVPLLPLIVPLLPAFLAFKGISAATGAITGASEAFGLLGTKVSLLKLEMRGVSGIGGVFKALGNVTGITAFAESIGSLVSVIGTVMGSIVSIIRIGAAAIGSAIFSIPVVGWILLAITALVGLFTYFYTQSEDFRNFVNGIFSGVAKFITDSFNGVVSFFAGVWSGITSGVTTVGTFFTNIWNGIVTTVSTAVTNIINFLQPIIAIVQFIISIYTAFYTVVFTIFSAIGQIIYSVVSTIVQIIGVVLVGTFNWLMTNVLIPFGEAFAQVWNGMSDAVSLVISIISQAITTGWNAIVAFFQPAVQGVTSFVSAKFNELAGAINTAFNWIRNSIINPISDAVGFVGRTIGQIVSFVGNALNDAYNTVRNWINNFTNAGKNVIDGLVNGIKNGAGSVVSTVQNIMKGALDAVKNFFGIHSPSTVMATMGDYLMQGFTKGINRSADETIAAAASAATNIQSAFSSITGSGDLSGQFDVAASLAPTNAASIDASAANSSPSRVDITQNNTINTEVDMDKVTRDLTWELSRA